MRQYQTVAGAITMALVTASCTGPTQPSDHTYRNQRYVYEINDYVEFVKAPRHVHVSTPFGSMSPAELRKQIAATWQRDYGAITPHLAHELNTLRADERIDVLVIYADPVEHDRYQQARSKDDSERGEALSTIRRLHMGAGEQLAARAQEVGLSTHRVSEFTPVIFGSITTRQVFDLGRLDGVLAVERYVAQAHQPAYHAARNFVTDPNHDAINNQGYTGQGIRIGLAEIRDCAIYGAHESINNQVTYSQSPLSCNTNSDCFSACSSSARCLNNQCVHRHTSQVGSVLLGNSDGQTWGAGSAHLYVYNGPFNPNCDPVGRDKAYTWFLQNGVRVVSQTFGCSLGATGQDGSKYGLIQDFYALAYGILTLKSAGNSADLNKQACPTTLNGICVGASLSHATYGSSGIDYMWTLSNWRNPFFDNPEVNSDREEPDVVALGGNVDVMGLDSTTEWVTGAGTSFSTPAVASMVASLMVAHPNLIDRPNAARVCMALASTGRDVDDMWRYSTPGKGSDFKDGAGGVDAALGLEVCREGVGGGGNGIGIVKIDTTRGEDPPPGDEPATDAPPPGQQTMSTLSASSSLRQVLPVGTYELTQGRRLRAVMAWRTCVGSNYLGSIAPSTVRLDLDLMLYRQPAGATPGEYVYLSQSLDDNIEGFDLVIPTTGTYTIYASWPDGDVGCSGTTQENAWFGIWIN